MVLCRSPVLIIWLCLLQVLSDESIRVSDLEVWVPDASGVLALSTHLLYDDAPWLTKKVACSTRRQARVTFLCCALLCCAVLCYVSYCGALFYVLCCAVFHTIVVITAVGGELFLHSFVTLACASSWSTVLQASLNNANPAKWIATRCPSS